MELPHIGASEVAEILGISLTTFRQRRSQLRKMGLPEPLPWNSRRWNRRQVLEFAEVAGQVDAAIDQADPKISLHPSARRVTAARCAQAGQRHASRSRS